jgi:tetratricopeptide (TPR) repeat protein
LVPAIWLVAQAERVPDLADLEREVAVAEGEMGRIEDQYRVIPELFSSDDREDRVTWGEILYLTKDYQRASLLLFGAVEPRSTDKSPVEQRPDYANAVYYLADSLFLLGNTAAAKGYFEKLLSLQNHGHHEQAILRLMEIGAAENRFHEVDQFFEAYLRVAKSDVPGQVRYLRGKSLFFAKKDDAALAELTKVPANDAYALRARYFMGAVAVRKGDFDAALVRFNEVAFAKPIAKSDRQVKEMAHLARGRLYYELDRLSESINAYQEINYDSTLLTTMLYEVTWTYVRRGQIALRGKRDDNKTDLERRDLAKVEYEKAIRQLQDLRALEPESDRAAEIDILAGNLRLQRNEFEKAEQTFARILEVHQDADRQLAALMADRSTKDRLLHDILAMSSGGLTVDSKLPPLAARRIAINEEVSKALAVFKGIERSRDEVESTAKLLASLEQQLSPENPNRAELFKPLQSGVARSSSLENLLVGAQARAVRIERSMARPSPDAQRALAEIESRRKALDAQIATLPKTVDEVGARKKRFADRLQALDRLLHTVELDAAQRRAELVALDFMVWRDPAQRDNQLRTELRKNQLRKERVELDAIQATAARMRERIEALKREIATMGGRGSSEDALRQAYARTFEEERALLGTVRDPAMAAQTARLDRVVAKVEALYRRNGAFRDRLDQLVEARLEGARALLAAEKQAISSYLSVLGTIDQHATAVRDRATEVALEKVRRDVSRVVLRADVGVVDTSFARKQAETEKIGQLQRARAAELTDLTQAYADLTKDEAP